MFEASIEGCGTDRVEGNRMWAAVEADRAGAPIDVYDSQPPELGVGGRVQQGEDPDEGLARINAGVGRRPASEQSSLLGEAQGPTDVVAGTLAATPRR